MAKRTYTVEQTAAAAAKTANNMALAEVGAKQFLADSSTAASFLGEGFEDKSLPAIIKTKGLSVGDVIIGEFDSFSEYDDGKKIQTALITIHILRGNVTTKQLERVGVRGALPVGAVLARALGASLNKQTPPSEINKQIVANGYGPGTIIAMRYNGTGKERNNQNAPHLWDIKIKKATGEVAAVGVDHGNKKGK